MNFLQEFEKVMENSALFALATSQNDAPNVRILEFYYDINNKGVVYFPTFKNTPKTTEFSQNNKVAFTTIPNGQAGVVRVKNAVVQKSNKTVNDIKDEIIKKFPGFKPVVENEGYRIDIYEIHFHEASVQAGHNNNGSIIL